MIWPPTIFTISLLPLTHQKLWTLLVFARLLANFKLLITFNCEKNLSRQCLQRRKIAS